MQNAGLRLSGKNRESARWSGRGTRYIRTKATSMRICMRTDGREHCLCGPVRLDTLDPEVFVAVVHAVALDDSWATQAARVLTAWHQATGVLDNKYYPAITMDQFYAGAEPWMERVNDTYLEMRLGSLKE